MNIPSILIVDDDAALLQALPQALYLRLPAAQVDTSDSALAALEMVRTRDYDAIVSDIKMPGMDGLALLAKIQELRPETPTLLITGHGEHDLAIQALRGGAYDFIQKPIDRDYFVAALKRAIQTHQLRHQVKEQQQALEQHARSLEQIVHERTRELIEANVAKDEFLGMASHELKTPLSSLKGMTQLMRRRAERTGSSEMGNLVGMERAIRRMERLVDDLLCTSFVEMQRLELKLQHVDLIELCRNARDEFIFCTYPPATIELDLPEGTLPADVDVDRLCQVIINLLSNAYKYSPKDAPIVLALERSGNECIISVRDRGIGIPNEVQQQIFERFYRIPGAEVQTGSSVGLGLGLYISRVIIERHCGRIEVHSQPGVGSTFTFTLPLAVNELLVNNEVDMATVKDQCR